MNQITLILLAIAVLLEGFAIYELERRVRLLSSAVLKLIDWRISTIGKQQ